MASQNDREMKIVILLLAAALLILGAVAVAAASDRTDRMPVAVFDLRRYMGTWYEIARYDHSFERRLAGVQAHYELLSDGRVTVENSGVDYRSDRRKRARGKARATAMPGRFSGFSIRITTCWNSAPITTGRWWAAVRRNTSGFSRAHPVCRAVRSTTSCGWPKRGATPPGNCCSWIRGREFRRLCRKGICQSTNTQSSPFERAGSRRKPSHSNDRSVAGSAMRFFRICRVISPRHIFV